MTTEDKIEQHLETQLKKYARMYHYYYNSVDFKYQDTKYLNEAKASILKLIEPKDVTGTYYDSGEGV